MHILVAWLIFMFCFFCSVCNCFAYDIAAYSKETPSESHPVLNLVFCPLYYQDKEVFLKDLDGLVQRLKKTRPFDEYIKETGFYYIDISGEEVNTIFKKTRDFPPLKARRHFLEYILARLKSDYKLIIVDALGSVSCAELSSADTMSLVILGKRRYGDNNSFTKGFLHELGHSLGLRDECVHCAQLCSPGPPNCAANKKEAESWWGDLVGKVPGLNYIGGCCGNKDYIRPTIASLMNDPDKAEDFGPVNERYLKKIFRKSDMP